MPRSLGDVFSKAIDADLGTTLVFKHIIVLQILDVHGETSSASSTWLHIARTRHAGKNMCETVWKYIRWQSVFSCTSVTFSASTKSTDKTGSHTSLRFHPPSTSLHLQHHQPVELLEKPKKAVGPPAAKGPTHREIIQLRHTWHRVALPRSEYPSVDGGGRHQVTRSGHS